MCVQTTSWLLLFFNILFSERGIKRREIRAGLKVLGEEYGSVIKTKNEHFQCVHTTSFTTTSHALYYAKGLTSGASRGNQTQPTSFATASYVYIQTSSNGANGLITTTIIRTKKDTRTIYYAKMLTSGSGRGNRTQPIVCVQPASQRRRLRSHEFHRWWPARAHAPTAPSASNARLREMEKNFQEKINKIRWRKNLSIIAIWHFLPVHNNTQKYHT